MASVIDVYTQRIVGGRASQTMTTDFVLDGLEQALYAREPGNDGSLIDHSDRGAQYVSIRCNERQAEAAIEPSAGSRGGRYDKVLAENDQGPLPGRTDPPSCAQESLESVELAILG